MKGESKKEVKDNASRPDSDDLNRQAQMNAVWQRIEKKARSQGRKKKLDREKLAFRVILPIFIIESIMLVALAAMVGLGFVGFSGKAPSAKTVSVYNVCDQDIVDEYNNIVKNQFNAPVATYNAAVTSGQAVYGTVIVTLKNALAAFESAADATYNLAKNASEHQKLNQAAYDEVMNEIGKVQVSLTAAKEFVAKYIVLYDFCVSLGIPVTIYGHSTDYRGVALYSYAEFDSVDENDRYRLMDMIDRSGNRDGAALRFVAEHLAKRPENRKLLILISDGQPADTGYRGTAAEADLRGIKKEYARQNIVLFAAAIGEDKDAIQRIYQEGFLDITRLDDLPKNLTLLVKQYLK